MFGLDNLADDGNDATCTGLICVHDVCGVTAKRYEEVGVEGVMLATIAGAPDPYPSEASQKLLCPMTRLNPPVPKLPMTDDDDPDDPDDADPDDADPDDADPDDADPDDADPDDADDSDDDADPDDADDSDDDGYGDGEDDSDADECFGSPKPSPRPSAKATTARTKTHHNTVF